jgi:phosphoribosylpyrophosphate synthetase
MREMRKTTRSARRPRPARRHDLRGIPRPDIAVGLHDAPIQEPEFRGRNAVADGRPAGGIGPERTRPLSREDPRNEGDRLGYGPLAAGETAGHPLGEIVRSLARPGSIEIVLQGSPAVVDPRAVDSSHFSILTGDAADKHVLLIDDTWTGGGHATSAALALRAAGVTKISVLALARWLSIGWEATTDKWAKSTLALPDYQPDVCPWTQGRCPPA